MLEDDGVAWMLGNMVLGGFEDGVELDRGMALDADVEGLLIEGGADAEGGNVETDGDGEMEAVDGVVEDVDVEVDVTVVAGVSVLVAVLVAPVLVAPCACATACACPARSAFCTRSVNSATCRFAASSNAWRCCS